MSKTGMTLNAPLAMSYVPWQRWDDVYSEKVALERGTAFPVLDLPFCAARRVYDA